MDVAETRGQRLAGWLREGLQVPFSAATLIVGSASIALVILGPLAVVAAHGFTPYERIVTAFQSDTTAVVLLTGIVMGSVAIAVGFSIYKRMPTKRAREQSLAGAILGIQAVALGGVFLWLRAGNPDRFTFHFLNFEKWEGYGGAFVRGAKNTVILAFVGEAGGVVHGLDHADKLIYARRVVRAPARTYINFFRGTPLIWQLSVFYFGFSIGLGFRLSAFTTAMIVFALNTAAYAAEVFRAGIQSIERGQMEAARSLGLTYMQSMRYAIVPQAIRRVIPPLMNEFVILIKDTSLVVVLGLLEREYDLFTVARQGYSETFNATLFVGAAIGYLIVTLPLIGAVNAVERRLRSGLVSVV
jgi:His/Glu/Gln/Arg/opine family amino acid ABC transporter permease subunit